jgi:hypothetical protein
MSRGSYKNDDFLPGRFGSVGDRVDVPALCFGQLVELVEQADNAGDVGRSFAALREMRRRRRAAGDRS